MDWNMANRFALQMNGLRGDWTPDDWTNLINAFGDGASKVIDSAKGNSISNQNTNSSTDPNQQYVYLPQPQDNTILYISLAAMLAMTLMFSLKKK